jgi:hypothetical protein
MKAEIFTSPKKNHVIGLLFGGWLLCIVLAAILHWRVLSYFAVVLLIAAILFFMLSIVYAMMGTPSPTKSEKKPKP